jgi:cyclopropane fatty-acyl-phospholipid synthase-like methyltransferase
MTKQEHDKQQHQSYDWANQTMAGEGTRNKSSHQSKMARVYDKYFSTGFYHLRYPEANKHTFHSILSELQKLEPGPRHILDFGCGSGRYLLPILKGTENNFTAYDISETPLKLLAERLDIEGGQERVSILHGDLEQLTQHIEKKGKVDLIMLMFGVLSHVGDRATRLKLLRRLGTFLVNDSSRIILSVPNQLRRFTYMNGDVTQADQEPGNITYSRSYKGTELNFFYHLYTPDTLVAELREAGLVVYKMCAESFFPECWVTSSAMVGVLDKAICKVLPTRQGYGILAVVGPNTTSGK